MRIAIVGDVHGDFERLRAVEALGPDLVIQCGDLGFWPRWPTVGPELEAFTPQVPIRFCDGNHEDLETLFAQRVPGEPPRAHEVKPGLFWQDRGSTMTLPDGRVVLFVGGAESIDAGERTNGLDWFANEERLYKDDLDRLPDVHVDIVVSHTCPESFRIFDQLPYKIRELNRRKFRDISMESLDRVLERYRPSLWFFGHWHCPLVGENGGCEWRGLPRIDKEEGAGPIGPIEDKVFWMEG